jgi:hypothetical protein
MPFSEVFAYRASILERFAHQPEELRELMVLQPESEWHTRRTDKDETLHQLTAHLCVLETQAFIPRITRMLTETNPHLDSFDDVNWWLTAYRADEPLTSIAATFAAARATLLAQLRPLDSEGWNRLGFHPPSGKRTVQWWVELDYMHTLRHLTELRKHLA